MKYCTKCGHELLDEAVLCPNCGCMTNDNAVKPVEEPADPVARPSGLKIAAKVFMILSTIICGICTFSIALAWMLPMTIVYCNKLKRNAPIGTGFKVCCLIFVNILAGIFMLCAKD